MMTADSRSHHAPGLRFGAFVLASNVRAPDLVLAAKEVNPVLQALRENDIQVTALHNHMLDDQPHLFFMHSWAKDDVQKLAIGLPKALDQINVTRS
jgi:hypothetical protein